LHPGIRQRKSVLPGATVIEVGRMEDTPIRHVTDTARWVATFRARETERADALFHDPLAKVLVGEEGERIVKGMDRTAAVSWAVIIRTCVIDDYLKELFTKGVDGVLNLGAGLDTRPYRMNLPADLQWFEADYPEMIAFKEDRLKGHTSGCRLERFGLDLADRDARARLLSTVQERCKKVVVLTEGVVPYLSNDEVTGLAKDLHAYDHLEFWIVEYCSKIFMQKMRNRKTHEKLRNAPLKFDPPDWMEFFADAGWTVDQLRHMPIEGRKLGRPAPSPFLLKLLLVFTSQERRKQLAQMFGYTLFRARRP